jgi:hypothetical protein
MNKRLFEMTVAEFKLLLSEQGEESRSKLLKDIKVQQQVAIQSYSDITNVEGAVLLTGLARGTIYNRVSAGTVPIISRTPLRFSKIQLLSWLSSDDKHKLNP